MTADCDGPFWAPFAFACGAGAFSPVFFVLPFLPYRLLTFLISDVFTSTPCLSPTKQSRSLSKRRRRSPPGSCRSRSFFLPWCCPSVEILNLKHSPLLS